MSYLGWQWGVQVLLCLTYLFIGLSGVNLIFKPLLEQILLGHHYSLVWCQSPFRKQFSLSTESLRRPKGRCFGWACFVGSNNLSLRHWFTWNLRTQTHTHLCTTLEWADWVSLARWSQLIKYQKSWFVLSFSDGHFGVTQEEILDNGSSFTGLCSWGHSRKCIEGSFSNPLYHETHL